MRHDVVVLLVALTQLGIAGCQSSQSAQRSNTTAQAPAGSVSGVQGAPARTPAMQATSAQPATGGGPEAAMGDMCPMEVPGATVAEQDSPGGATLIFTTSGDVARLRERVRAVAEMHNRHQAAMSQDGGMHMHGSESMHGHMHGGMMGSRPDGGAHMHGGMTMVPAEARSQDIERGAALVLTARNPADVEALRAHARQHAQEMASGHCGMMHGR